MSTGQNKAIVARWFTEFWGTADLIAEGDYVVGQWEGGRTQNGDVFDDMPYGPLPASPSVTGNSRPPPAGGSRRPSGEAVTRRREKMH